MLQSSFKPENRILLVKDYLFCLNRFSPLGKSDLFGVLFQGINLQEAVKNFWECHYKANVMSLAVCSTGL